MGQNNHQGIRVIFTPVSIAGQADTTFTNSLGQYSAPIQPGVYTIAFDKTGFNPSQYAGGQGQALTGNDTLLDVTLNTLYYKYVSGTIRDTLYADTIYIATTNLTVPNGAHLYLKAGTHLWFEGNYSLTINGNFDAVGTPNAPVIIGYDSIQNPGLQWDELNISGGSDTAYLEYCTIFGAYDGVRFTDVPAVKARYNQFRDSRRGVWFIGNTNVLFEENEMSGLTDLCIHLRTGVNTYSQINCNYLHDAAATGIASRLSYGDLDIMRNTMVNLAGNFGGGLDLETYAGDVVVADNAILNSTAGMELLVVDSTVSTTLIRNNLFYGNNTGLLLRAADGGAVITMNAFMDNILYGVAQPYPPGGTPDVFSYNLVSGSPTNYYFLNIPGVGVNVLTNVNGTPCDGYFNIADPGVYTPLVSVIPGVQANLINAGDPLAPLDADGSVTDIGIRADQYCFTSYQGYSALVYPGDANYNQAVNAWDLLTIGQHYGTTGPARLNPTLNWEGQLAANWGMTQTNGEDLKFADCNGDGIIDGQDTTAILVNYQSVHTGTSNRVGAGGVPLYFDMPTTPGNPGDTIVVPLYLGKVDTPAVNIYGMAFSIAYDSSMIEPGSMRIEFDSSWVGSMGLDMIGLQKDLFAQEKIDLAFSRIDQQDQTGYGRIANIIIVLDEDIAKTMLPLQLSFRDIEANDHAGSLLAVDGRRGEMTVDTEPNTATPIPDELDFTLQVYPNPAHQQLTLSLEGAYLESLILLNQVGNTVYNQSGLRTQSLQISTMILPSGLYFLRLQTDRGEVVRKLQVLH